MRKTREEVEAIMASDLGTLAKYRDLYTDRDYALNSWYLNLLFRRLLTHWDLPLFKELCHDV